MELLMGGSGQTESGGASSTESSSLSGGLRFGQKIYFEDGSGSGSKNRVGAGHKSSTTARCQVEGCKMDLSNAKAYYSRHKVCCIHSKSSKVIVSGLHQRFCQQCSRFHQLSEFDLEKRSCRRRLACHNERRRKPQPTTLYTRIAASLYGNANAAMIKSVLGDPTVWSTARSVMRRSGPWQINPVKESHHQHMNVFSQESSSFTITCPEMMNNNSTDSSCALSLLSNSNSNPIQQQQQQLQTQTNIWRPSSGFDYMTVDRVTLAQPPPIPSHHQYLNQTLEFMTGEKNSSHYMSPALGPSQISAPDEFQISNGTTMDGFELSLHQQVLRQYMAPENTRAYDSSPHHFNWSL
ncbi:PREDICTED: squamosa promoter-binding-like protein 15 [Camelina sativa]|uniref:Squamosa promoter-binding-like protein 15 n=1 Tax=Camelina sativa TaxID=90675 RepID=A0ABM0YR87_CAMSA|nr:PREDICTED: squamosa promoter-binding-like protein 15 [Camelina sativa]